MPFMVYCTSALTSFSDSVNYITFLFLEWHIEVQILQGNFLSFDWRGSPFVAQVNT